MNIKLNIKSYLFFKLVLTSLIVSVNMSYAAKGEAHPEANQKKYIFDRVYTADQNSNTVSVYHPGTQKFLGQIVLGTPRGIENPDILNPLYKGEVNVHGMGFSPDHKTLCVVSDVTHRVTFINTETNTVIGATNVGLAPHECFFTQDGTESWVSVRGEDHLAAISMLEGNEYLQEVDKINVEPGPGMTIFERGGHYAYVCNSFNPIFQVVDVQQRKVVKTLSGLQTPFCPFLYFSPDETEIWLTHKDQSGYITRIGDIKDMDNIHIKEVLETGYLTNHLFPIHKNNSDYIYVTIGGENVVKVYKVGQDKQPSLLVNEINVPARPHGIWASPDYAFVYIGLENADGVAVIDTHTDKVVSVMYGGQAPQALVYVPNAVSPDNTGTENLEQPFTQIQPVNYLLYAGPAGGQARGFVNLRNAGLVDIFTVNASYLKPNTTYSVYIKNENTLQEIALFETNPNGIGHTRTVGPIRTLINTENIQAAADYEIIIVKKGDSPKINKDITLTSQANDDNQ